MLFFFSFLSLVTALMLRNCGKRLKFKLPISLNDFRIESCAKFAGNTFETGLISYIHMSGTLFLVYGYTHLPLEIEPSPSLIISTPANCLVSSYNIFLDKWADVYSF